MVARAIFFSVILSSGFAGLAPAQSGHRWKPDPHAVQFAWVSANVVVTASDSDGTGVLAFTSRAEHNPHQHYYTDRFDPELMLAWLNQAHAVVVYQDRPTAAADLHTPSLAGRDGGQLTLIRARTKDGWSDRTEFVFQDSAGGPAWSIGATRRQADSLIAALFAQAARSRLVLRAGRLADSSHVAEMPGDRPPMFIGRGPMPSLPDDLRGQELYVSMRFVIGTDGRPEPDSFVAVFYDDPRLADIAYQVLMSSRYEPGILGGKPVRVAVQQGVAFHRH